MYAARDRQLVPPIGYLGRSFPYLSMLLMTFFAVFRLVNPIVEAGSDYLKAVLDNDRQVRNM